MSPSSNLDAANGKLVQDMRYGQPCGPKCNVDTLLGYCSMLVRNAPGILYKASIETNMCYSLFLTLLITVKWYLHENLPFSFENGG
jgi:hypothetical protein